MKTSKKLKRWAPILKALITLTPSERSHILRNAKPELIAAISECTDNLLRGAVPLSKAQLGKLRKHRKQLHTLASNQIGLGRKKAILSNRQTGGFLPLLLAPLAGVLGSVLGEVVSGAIRRSQET